MFSPARYSALPGAPFPGDPEHYPTRDEVVDYLRGYAKQLDADIRTATRVISVRHYGGIYTVVTDSGAELATRIVIAATGGFGCPYVPRVPGLGHIHRPGSARQPVPGAQSSCRSTDTRGWAGNSAVQIAAELAGSADVTLATRNPVKYVPQRPLGKDMHFWFTVTGIDTAPVGPGCGTRPRRRSSTPAPTGTRSDPGDPTAPNVHPSARGHRRMDRWKP